MSWLRPLAPLLALLALAAAPAAAHASDAPIAAYGFEETSTTTVDDNSGNGHTGTILGGAAHVTGHSGTALSFDGVNDRVSIPDSAAFALTTGATLEAWVKPATTAGWRTVVLKERPGDLSYALYGSGPDKPNAQVFAGGDYRQAVAPSSNPVNQWTHLALTYDGAVVKLFVNGTQVATTTGGGSITGGSGPLDIGGNSIWTEWFNGVIDDVRVYDRALTATEITSDMNTPVSGTSTPPPPPPPPPPGADQVGTWTPPQDWPMVAVHASMLSNGKVVAWDAFGSAPGSEHIWDPQTGQFVSTPSGINLFCAGHVLLPDGRLFTAGGHEAAYVGIRNTALLNPLTSSWTLGPDMAYGRWYPTATTMPDGRILIVSGDAIQQGGPYTAFYAPSDTTPEIYDPATNTIHTVPQAARRMPLYPFMFVAPDGRIVDAGPDKTTRLFDPATGLWSTLASQSPIDGHSAVMYRPGKILKSGTWTDPDFPNTVPITNRAAVLDLDQGVPSWREVSPMHNKRTFHTLTVLPDGDVLSLAGQSKAGSMSVTTDPVLEPEIWHPATDTWTTMAPSEIGRGYHNTSLLLPDGRVLLAGSGRLDGSLMPSEENAEIYSPPYLFKGGTRPTITYAPPSMSYGGKITVATPDADSVAKVSLVRIGAVTHNFNMDQRWEELSFRKVGADLEIDAPTTANDAPPGVYYVFLLNANGVPSKAAILSIAAGSTPPPPPDTQAPTAPGNLSATGALGKVTLSWSASTDNVGVTKYNVYRSTTTGFTPGAGNLVATVASGTSFADNGIAAGTYFYRVIAEDAAGNKSAASAEASGTALADTTAPAVSLTAPAAGTVSGTVAVSATASDDVGVAGVQFRLDGANLGSEDTSSPYGVSWDTTGLSGSHTLTAIARDAADNKTTATSVSVTVDNSAPPAPTPVAAYSFDAGSGTSLADTTGKGHTGTIREAAWTTTGKFGGALRFDGVNDWVTIADAADLRLSTGMTLEAWVNPTNNAGWRTAIFKERTADLAYALYAGGSTTPLGTLTTSAAGYGEAGNVAGSAPAVNTWTHLATTYDGTTLRLFKNGAQIASTPYSGAIFAGTGALRLGGNNIWSEWFAGQLDDVRVYNQALTGAQIQADMSTPAGTPPPPDTQAPTVPSNVAATGALGKVTLSWTASTDNVGVTKYSVYRSTTTGFTPGAGNLIATVTSGTSYPDNGLAAGTYFYRVIAEDAAGNKSAASAEASGTATADTTAPAVSLTAPAAGTVSGTVAVSATASDDVGVAGVQFKLDGANLGSEDTTSPYGVSWDTTGLSGSHTLTAVARDAAAHATTSASVIVTVDNSAPPGPTPVAAYSFDAGTGTSLADTTGKGHTGTIREAAWTTTGKHAGALRFDGVNDWVTIADATDLRLSTAMTLEAWVNPTNNSGWRTAIFKERTGDLAYALYAGGATTPLGTITTSAAGYGEAGNVAGSAPAVNTWTHLATTYDGTTLKLFKNGTQIASTPYTGAIFAGTGPLRLGGNQVWSEWFAGQLDDVRVYNQALTGAQITTDMNAAVS